MKKSFITFRSLTYAQMAQKALERQAIYGDLIRTPADYASCGCGYSIRLPSQQVQQALSILDNQHIEYSKVFERREGQ